MMYKGFFAMVLVLLIMSCNTSGKRSKNVSALVLPQDVTVVLYFHGKQRCATCNAIEERSREVVAGMDSSQVIMRVVDIAAPENRATAEKYEVTWSSLILERNGKAVNLTDVGFGYARNEPEVFKAKLMEAIQQLGE